MSDDAAALRRSIVEGLSALIESDRAVDFRSAYLFMSANVRRASGDDPQLIELLDRAERTLAEREREHVQRLVNEALTKHARPRN